MINLLIGIAVGAAFAPFWMMLWNTYLKLAVDKVLSKFKSK